MSVIESANVLNMTDEELAILVTRACEVFGDETIERALASAASARADEGALYFRGAIARELQRLLTAH